MLKSQHRRRLITCPQGTEQEQVLLNIFSNALEKGKSNEVPDDTILFSLVGIVRCTKMPRKMR